MESFWAKRHVQFEKFALSVANRRVEIAFDAKKEFSSFLSDKMPSKYDKLIQDALKEISTRIRKSYAGNSKYDLWIESKESLDIENYQKLVEWRSLEILLYRDKNRKQQTLFSEESNNTDELEQQEGNDIKIAAQLFLNQEYKIPFYFGISTICKLASSNIEQFLNLSGELFDIVLSNSVKQIADSNHELIIHPDKQEEIVKRIVSEKWKNLSNSMGVIQNYAARR